MGIQKVIEELIAISLLGAIYIMAFAGILNDAITNYTGGGAKSLRLENAV